MGLSINIHFLPVLGSFELRPERPNFMRKRARGLRGRLPDRGGSLSQFGCVNDILKTVQDRQVHGTPGLSGQVLPVGPARHEHGQPSVQSGETNRQTGEKRELLSSIQP